MFLINLPLQSFPLTPLPACLSYPLLAIIFWFSSVILCLIIQHLNHYLSVAGLILCLIIQHLNHYLSVAGLTTIHQVVGSLPQSPPFLYRLGFLKNSPPGEKYSGGMALWRNLEE
jgi:hypothetical protein